MSHTSCDWSPEVHYFVLSDFNRIKTGINLALYAWYLPRLLTVVWEKATLILLLQKTNRQNNVMSD